MTRPIVRIHDLSTDEIVDREMNDTEYAAYQTEQASATARAAEEQAKENARQALLNKLGISSDEAKLLLGGN